MQTKNATPNASMPVSEVRARYAAIEQLMSFVSSSLVPVL